jgi:hypothetical protein
MLVDRLRHKIYYFLVLNNLLRFEALMEVKFFILKSKIISFRSFHMIGLSIIVLSVSKK